MAALAGGFSSTLQQLTLDSSCCSQLGAAGLAALAGGLSTALQQLSLNFELFDACLQFGDAGLAA